MLELRSSLQLTDGPVTSPARVAHCRQMDRAWTGRGQTISYPCWTIKKIFSVDVDDYASCNAGNPHLSLRSRKLKFTLELHLKEKKKKNAKPELATVKMSVIAGGHF